MAPSRADRGLTRAGSPQILMYMPELTMLYNLVDKLKVIGDTLHISTSSSGELCFRVATDSIEFSTRFTNLKIVKSGGHFPSVWLRVQVCALSPGRPRHR